MFRNNDRSYLLNMKPRMYIILVALLLAGIFLLWPRVKHEPTAPDPNPLPAGHGGSAGETRKSLRPDNEPVRPVIRAPERPDIEITPESPPEQTLQWQISRQNAMLDTLQRHIASNEAKLRNTTDPAERQTIQGQLDILKIEMSNQLAVLRELQQ